MPTVRVANPAPSRAEILEENRKLRTEKGKLESQLKATDVRQGNPVTSRSDLLAQIRALREENNELQDKLDDIADLASARGEDATQKRALLHWPRGASSNTSDLKQRARLRQGNRRCAKRSHSAGDGSRKPPGRTMR